MWYKDSAGQINDTGDENAGVRGRGNLTAEIKKVDIIGNIHDDVFRKATLMHKGVTVNVRFVRDSEHLVSDQPKRNTMRTCSVQLKVKS